MWSGRAVRISECAWLSLRANFFAELHYKGASISARPWCIRIRKIRQVTCVPQWYFFCNVSNNTDNKLRNYTHIYIRFPVVGNSKTFFVIYHLLSLSANKNKNLKMRTLFSLKIFLGIHLVMWNIFLVIKIGKWCQFTFCNDNNMHVVQCRNFLFFSGVLLWMGVSNNITTMVQWFCGFSILSDNYSSRKIHQMIHSCIKIAVILYIAKYSNQRERKDVSQRRKN